MRPILLDLADSVAVVKDRADGKFGLLLAFAIFLEVKDVYLAKRS